MPASLPTSATTPADQTATTNDHELLNEFAEALRGGPAGKPAVGFRHYRDHPGLYRKTPRHDP